MSTQSPTQKQFLALALPNMMAAMAVPITELVDLAYLGHLDSVTPLSGVVLATVIFSYIYWCFSFLRVGTTGLTAQAAGRDDTDEQEALFWRACLLGLFIGIVLTLLRHPIENLSFWILAGSAEVEQAGRDYYQPMIWGAIAIMVDLAIIGWLLGQGKAMTVWILHTVWQVSNIILNYFFIVQFGWGAWGAGLGTTLAEWISLVFGIGAVIYHWRGIPHFNRQNIFDWVKMKTLLTLNSAIMLRTFLLMSVLAAFTNISATFGEVKLAANALMMQLFAFYAYVCDGYAIALEILAGKAAGRNNKDELRRAFRLTLNWALWSALVFAVAYGTISENILSLIADHENVIAATAPYIGWMCTALIIGGAAFVFDGLFYGLAQPKTLSLSMLAAVCFFIPPAYIAWQEQSTHWLWGGFLLFTTMRAIILVYPVRKALR